MSINDPYYVWNDSWTGNVKYTWATTTNSNFYYQPKYKPLPDIPAFAHKESPLEWLDRMVKEVCQAF